MAKPLCAWVQAANATTAPLPKTLEERHEFPSTGLEGERGNPIRRQQCYIPRDIGDLIDAHQPDYSGVGGVLEAALVGEDVGRSLMIGDIERHYFRWPRRGTMSA